MNNPKRCYNCFSEVDESVTLCPRCKFKLGARTPSGVAAKPGSPLLKIFLVVCLLAVGGKIAVHSYSDKPASGPVTITTGANDVKDGAIQKIKEKGAGELGAVGVADIGYKDDTLCVYVDQRFNNLSESQQVQVVTLVAVEWGKALGKISTPVKILEYGTDKTLAELVV